MGVIAVLAVLTLMSFKAVTANARVASATNTIKAALGNARALAMRDNKLVIVAFRAKWDPAEPHKPQFVEVVVAEWSGKTVPYSIVDGETNVADVFVVSPGAPIRELPVGIKVGGPATEAGDLGCWQTWHTQPELPKVTSDFFLEAPGRMIGVMFGPDGAMLTRNPNSSAADQKSFVDFCPGDCQLDDANTVDIHGIPDPQDVWFGDEDGNNTWAAFWEYDDPLDETNVVLVPYLAVYDDIELREQRDDSGWFDECDRNADLDSYLERNGNRINFNRYTGVVMQ